MNRTFTTVALIALFAALGGVGYFIVLKKRQPVEAPPEQRAWLSQTLLGMTLESPGDFEVKSLDLPETREVVQKSEIGVYKNPNFEIDVLRTVYKEGVELNFDGAAQGAAEGVSKLDGIRNVQQTISELSVSGKPARRLSMTADRWQKKMGVEVLLISDGPAFYQVQVIFDTANPRALADAMQVLKSVRLGR
jgi:hypothetical protein